jgi:membrane protease YdiL (CAAX protease family)
LLAQPSGFSIESLFSTPIVGAKSNESVILIGLAVLQLISTYLLGEGLLFRGILLPKMQGVFGKLDWPANGLLYAVFHLHKPWCILSAIPGGILYAQTTRDHRCAWLGAIAHSVEGLFLLCLILESTV